MAVFSTALFAEFEAPEGYYSEAEGLLGADLKAALHDIIDDHIILDYFDDIPLIFRTGDVDPENPDNILLLYSGESVPASSRIWNREHTWPRSFGIGDTGAAFADAHHLFAADSDANSDRSNYVFADLSELPSAPMDDAPESLINPSLRLVEPRDADKGRIARAMFYMDTRYDADYFRGDLLLTDDPVAFTPRFGQLQVLLEWNRAYPPDERERRRNELIHLGTRVGNTVVFQANRNPFIDHPELVDAVFTADKYLTWGTWAVDQFTFAELANADISGRFADPDIDGRPNYLEFALQTNPLGEEAPGEPAIIRGETRNFFRFMWFPEAEASYLSYSVEVSQDPFENASWEAIPFTGRDLQTAERGRAFLASLAHAPADPERPAFYRLRIGHAPPNGEAAEHVIDPSIRDTGGLHAFTYTLPAAEGWHRSDWFGFLKPAQAPWFYHDEHGWLYTDAASAEVVWFFDPALGWCFTSEPFYPMLFVVSLGDWLTYLRETRSPERWFYRPSLDAYVKEADLFPPST